MNGFASSRLAARLCLGAALALAAPAFGQAGPPAADAAALNGALRALAQNPNSVEALVAAGNASLKVDDSDAALGFFRRAATLSPQDGRATAGLAAVMVRERHPLEALRLFAQVEQAGALSPASLAERGLAYDLIGDNARAQKDYATALALGPDPIVTRRLALSQAIAGNEAAAEATLLPLLQHGDLAAYRTRAFSLAISGRGDEAVSIAETMLPATLSSRIAPYLRYMPRLTRAQQAAAANLGAFPHAGDIGRDDPQIAAYAATLGVSPARAAQSADARLVPNGAPLGAATPRPTVAAATPTPPPVRTAAAAAPPPARTVSAAATPAPPVVPPTEPAPRTVARSTSAGGDIPERARAMLLQHPELAHGAAPRAGEPPAARPSPKTAPQVAQPSPAPPVAVPSETRVTAAAPPPAAIAPSTPAVPAPAEPPPSSGSAPVVVARLAEAQPPPSTTAPETAPAATVPTPAPTAPPTARPSLSDAFGDLRAAPPAPAAAAPTGAVDITRIQPRRPAAPPKAAPKPPPVPSREWVQVATGRSTGALAFDWRRLKKEAGGALDREKPSTAEWGRTHRLVIGPFASTTAADRMVARLKDKKIDAFRFTSDEGQDVAPLE